MIPTDAASIISKLVSTDELYFSQAVDLQHKEIDWLAARRKQAHAFVDRLFDNLEGAAKNKLEDLLTHTMENGLAPQKISEIVEEHIEDLTAKGTDND